ncbi:MAG: RDD family protein [Paracoccaceae bacterium]
MFAPLADTLPDPARHAEFYSGTATKRGLAWLVDTAVILGICLLILPFTAFTALFFWPLFYITIGFLYRWITLARGSATWGMRLASIRFLDRDGRPFDTGSALLHTALYSVCISSILPQLISIASMLVTPRGQSLPDLILGSVCINRAARH